MTNPLDPNHPFHALTKYPQWVMWELIQRPGKPKPDKVPVDPVSRRAIDPHDPRNQITADQALTFEAASGGTTHAGFVFTDDDPFFFVDIDNSLITDETGVRWSDFTNQTCNLFNGAAVEVSQSGTGIHIIGVGTVPPGYGTRNKSVGLEVYHTKRFVALNLGGTSYGNAWTDHTEALNAFVPHYIKPADVTGADVDGVAGWTDAPRPEWNGPADDDALIAKMLSSRGSANQIFGSRATFDQLWNADAEALGQFFPDEGDRPFGASEADASLLSHLAFWTGCDCDRMKRLFERSGLMKYSKWETRPDYQTRSILNATSMCKSVYAQKQGVKDQIDRINEPVSDEDMNWGASHASDGLGTLKPRRVTGSTVMTPDEQVAYFDGCVYVTNTHRIFTPNGRFLKPDVFNAKYGGFSFIIDEIDGKPTDKAFDVFTRSRTMRFPKVDAICFRPNMSPGSIIEEEGFSLFNTYVPAKVIMQEGDATPFISHMAKILPDETDREIVLSYLAAVVQYPGVKFQWCPVIQGAQGNGKSLIGRCLAYAVGTRYTHLPNAAELGGAGTKFNAWIENRLLIIIEEIHTRDRHDVIEALKPLITDATLEIQGKGMDQYTGENHANFIAFSNHRDAIMLTKDDRRYAVFYTAQQSHEDLKRDDMEGTDYFPNLYNWLRQGGYAIVAHYLKNYKIAEQFNPAGQCHRAPKTSVHLEVLEESRGTVEQEIIEHIAQGCSGMSNGWISSLALDDMLISAGMSRRIPRNKRKAMLRELGYIQHPHLLNGRCTSQVIETFGSGKTSTGRPVLYVKEGSLQCNLTDPAAIQDAYTRAQGWGKTSAAGAGVEDAV